MKRVTVCDDAPRHAVGWDPDGVEIIFFITEPLVGTSSGAGIDVYIFSTFSFRTIPAMM
jgi:hypothetical protein